MEQAHVITQLCQHMARPRLVLAARHASLAAFIHKDLHKCTHIFYQGATHRVLEPPYSGPYRVLSQGKKTLQLLVRGKPVTVSTVERGRLQKHHFQPRGQRNPSHNTVAASYRDYMLRSPCSLPRTPEQPSAGGGESKSQYDRPIWDPRPILLSPWNFLQTVAGL
jgi:hypothetical protein